MNKIMTKLITSILALVVAASLAVMSTYAWVTISGAPEVDGIQVNIGGSNTIMVAADMVVVDDDGSVHHYPGEFSQDLNLMQYDSYDYLQELSGLTPVSTSDGVSWFLPVYYQSEDPLVQKGLAVDAQIKDISQFLLDNQLTHANIVAQEEQETNSGGYVYLDFWVVAPASNYRLRVSTGDASEDSGSYVISLMAPTEMDTDGDGENDAYTLQAADQTVAASIRVGFLANQDFAKYDDMLHYLASDSYVDRYTHLMGQYQEPGENILLYANAQNRFTIYEPNGDLHPTAEGDTAGYYQITKPLGIVDGVISETDIQDILTVQKSSVWNNSVSGLGTMIEQEFQTAVAGRAFQSDTLNQVFNMFYQERLQGQLSRYLSRGMFVENTGTLYSVADTDDGIVAHDSAVLRMLSGATEDVYITTLQKDVPQRIRMFIWIEGQDSDCINHVTASSIAINIELAGSNDV